MKIKRYALVAITGIALSVTMTGTAQADPVTATIADSYVTIQTPLYMPGKYECAKYPFTYQLAPDVNVATVSILDAYGGNVDSRVLTASGAGGGSFQVCGLLMEGKQSPYTLSLETKYLFESGKPDQTASSAPFTIQSKGTGSVKCKKVTPPKKGIVKTFKAAKCPSGWSRA